MRTLFRRNHARNRLIEERWSTRFRRFGDHRFEIETSTDYSVSVETRALRLAIYRPQVFAWTDNPNDIFSDFVLSAEIRFNGESPCAAGFLFRKSDDHTFYYILVSREGKFRFDSVVNGSPIPLVAWTECPVRLEAESFRIRVVARGDSFTFYQNEEWIGEVVDNSILSGRIAFGAQNFGDSCAVSLTSITVESRPFEVEAAYYRSNSYLPVDPNRRLILARTFFRMGQFAESGVQVRRAGNDRELTSEEHFLLGSAHLNMGEYEAALESVETAIELDHSNDAAIAEKANLLYLTDRLGDFEAYFIRHEASFELHPGMLNLRGNCAFALSNWQLALDSYDRAISLQDDVALFYLNSGRCKEQMNDPEGAVEAYTNAARLFFDDEAYDEIDRIVARLETIAPDSLPRVEIAARLAFAEGRLSEANRLLTEATERGTADSSIYFLIGIIEARSHNRGDANESFARAIALEPDYPLYHFRYAENRYLAGLDAEDAIERAIELAPTDGWTLNLAGMYSLDCNRYLEAEGIFTRALGNLPEESDIVANLADAKFRLGDVESALALLESRDDSAACVYQRGEIEAETGELSKAIETLRSAVSMDPENETYREKLAAVLFEDDRIHESEELLQGLLERDSTPRRLNLVAQIARAKGEYLRGESALVEALKIEPSNQELKYNLASHYYFMGAWEEAIEILDGSLDNRAVALRNRAVSASRRRIECAGCSREWWAPREIATQPVVKLKGEPPVDSPAGKCPSCGSIFCVECASRSVTNGRFHCGLCGARLNLNDDHLKYLVLQYVG